MRTKYTVKRVGEVVGLERRVVEIDPLATYRLIGVYSFGKGIFHREPAVGSDLGSYRFSLVKDCDLVLSNIQAWEGAIALAGPEDDGCIGTHRFLTYVPIDEQADTNYLRYFFLSEQGMELIRKASPGSIVRNRTLGIEAFESLEIPLPPIDVQRDSARRLDTIIRRAAEGLDLVAHADQQRVSLIDAMIQRHFDSGIESGWPLLPLGEAACINPSPTRLEPNTAVSFVPMSAVDAVMGQILHPEVQTAADLKPHYKQFFRGDVIFARITPCMQNGKTAVVDGLPTDYGYGSTEFHVVRPGALVTANWLQHIFRTATFKASAARHFTGTAGQQRVPASFLEETLIPIPPIAQQRILIARLESILQAGRDLAGRQSLHKTRFTALQGSILNETFAPLE